VKFEFDTNKSLSNKEKHGIDFIEAQMLFQKDFTFHFIKEVDGESRYILSSFLEAKCWSVIFTTRNENIRIISVRRCREKEKKALL